MESKKIKWNRTNEILLISWANSIKELEKKHNSRGVFYRRLDVVSNVIQITSNISSLSLLSSSLVADDFSNYNNIAMLYIAVFFSSLLTLIQAFSTYMNMADLSNKHFQTVKSMSGLLNYISLVLSFDVDDRDSPYTVLKLVKKKYDTIIEEGPNLSNEITTTLPFETKELTSTQIGGRLRRSNKQKMKDTIIEFENSTTLSQSNKKNLEYQLARLENSIDDL